MIFPPLHWAQWAEVERRSREIDAEANATTARGAPVYIDPAILESRFMDDVDAFLDDTADSLKSSRSEIEQWAVAGRLEWRHDYGRGYFVRLDGGPAAILHRIFHNTSAR